MSSLDLSILHSLASEYNQLAAAGFGVATLLATTAVYYSLNPKHKEDEFPKLPGIQLYHAWNFFQQRLDFLNSNFKRNSGQCFSFDVLHHKVIALTGEDARRVFYSDPRLDMSEGFKLLSGGAPKPRDLRPKEAGAGGMWDITRFNKAINKLLSKARIQDILPTLMQDIIGKVDKWGDTGKFDPFDEIFDLIFLMTARLATCDELTRNEADLKKIGDLLSALSTNATPTALVLPWFPSSAKAKTQSANMTMFLMLRTYVEARRQAVPTSDVIDILIAEGEPTQGIVQFIATIFFAGVTNVSNMACWTLIDFAIYPEWREKCKKEIRELFLRHYGDSSGTLREKLSAVPVSAWEDELPILDACTRESHRMAFNIASTRRNVGEDIKFGGKVVARGDFLTYPMSEVHRNPDYYPQPDKYDPGRWLRPDPVPKAVFPFLGWGAGRNPCPGMKLAKVEMKFVVAMFLMRYEYRLVHQDGKFPNPLPVPDTNDSRLRPVGSPVYLQFKKVAE